ALPVAADRNFRRHGGDSGGAWRIRRDGVPGDAADAGDRDSDGHRGAPGAGARADSARIFGAGRARGGGGCRGGVGADAFPGRDVVRRHGGGWRDVFGGGAAAGGGGHGGIAVAGAQGIARGPGGGTARRVRAVEIVAQTLLVG